MNNSTSSRLRLKSLLPFLFAIAPGAILAFIYANETAQVTNALTAVRSMQSLATLNGVVTDKSGAKIDDVVVSLYSKDRVLQTRSNSQGQFRFARVPQGEYQFEVVRDGFIPRKPTVIRLIGRNEPLAITLDVSETGHCINQHSTSYADTPGRKLTGVVLTSEQPLANAQVDLVGTSALTVVATTRSNNRGEFSFANLQPGEYSMRVSRSGFRDEQVASCWVAKETTTTVKIEMIGKDLLRVCQ